MQSIGLRILLSLKVIAMDGVEFNRDGEDFLITLDFHV